MHVLWASRWYWSMSSVLKRLAVHKKLWSPTHTGCWAQLQPSSSDEVEPQEKSRTHTGVGKSCMWFLFVSTTIKQSQMLVLKPLHTHIKCSYGMDGRQSVTCLKLASLNTGHWQYTTVRTFWPTEPVWLRAFQPKIVWFRTSQPCVLNPQKVKKRPHSYPEGGGITPKGCLQNTNIHQKKTHSGEELCVLVIWRN